MQAVFNLVGAVVFGTFVAIKVGGTALAAWSWWWLLMPFVPVIAFTLKANGVQF